VRGNGIEGDRDGDKAGSREKDHEQRVDDRVQLAAPLAGEDVSDAVHGVDLGVLELELANDVATPCGEKADYEDDWG
jgi:hypothetical protein